MPEIIAPIIESALGCRPLATRHIQGQGVANHVWDVATEKGSFILRFSAYPDKVNCYEKEAWCIDAAARAGIPSATVVGLGEMDGTSWMLQTRIEGSPGNEWPGDQRALWRETGRLAAILNEIPVSGYGGDMVDASGLIRFSNPGWEETVNGHFDTLFADDVLVRSGTLTPAQNAAAAKKLAELYEWDFESRLSHADLVPKNTIVGTNGQVHLIDYGIAGGGRPLFFELCSLCAFEKDPDMTLAFCEGYGLSHEEYRKVIKPELAPLTLLRSLLHAAWAYRNDVPDKEKELDIVRRKAGELVGFKPAAPAAAPQPLTLAL